MDLERGKTVHRYLDVRNKILDKNPKAYGTVLDALVICIEGNIS